MPRYEFVCHNCKKLFSKILSLVDYGEGEVLCPHCRSKEVEQVLVGLQRHHVEEERLHDDICGPLHQFSAIDTAQ